MERKAYRAGSFYESDPGACRTSAAGLIDAAALPADLPDDIFGGLVPHAGWAFSGRSAALTVKALAERDRLSRVVIFGADHWGIADGAAVYDRGSWQTPLGRVAVDEELAAALIESCAMLRADPAAHAREHSIEVQLPLIQVAAGQGSAKSAEEVRIVPINVTPSLQTVQIGREVGELLKDRFGRASVIGSTDLTHYGPQYGFTPGGVGPSGLEWARDNDHRVLKLIEALRAEDVVAETASRQNACGGGAIAAAMAACSAMGATRGICLEYTTSAEVMAKMYGAQSDDAVGYAAVVFA